MESVPYTEINDGEFFTRTFLNNIPDDELKWHFDDENRIIIPVKGTGWKIQIDESLPEDLIIGKKYFIPVDVYHRIIKGDDDLELKLYKLDCIKGENPKYERRYDLDDKFSNNLIYHINNGIKLDNNIFRYGSDAWCDLIQESKELYEKGQLEFDDEELELIDNDSGKIIYVDGQKYILNTPFLNTDESSEFKYFVYICSDNLDVKKIDFNAKDP